MKCDDARSTLETYLDGELDRATLDDLEAHLSTCEHCRAELTALEQLRARIKEVPRYRAPRALRQQLQALDDLPTQAQDARRLSRWPIWSIAASVLVSFTLGSTVMWLQARHATLTSQQQLLAQDLLDSHLRALAAANPVDVVSEDRHTVKPWFAGKVGVSPSVVDLSAQGFPLLGGRIDYVGGQRTAVVVYGHGQHVIDVYWTPDSAEYAPPSQMQGYWVASCRVAGGSVQIATDIEQEALMRFCGLLERSATPAAQTR